MVDDLAFPVSHASYNVAEKYGKIGNSQQKL